MKAFVVIDSVYMQENSRHIIPPRLRHEKAYFFLFFSRFLEKHITLNMELSYSSVRMGFEPYIPSTLLRRSFHLVLNLLL